MTDQLRPVDPAEGSGKKRNNRRAKPASPPAAVSNPAAAESTASNPPQKHSAGGGWTKVGAMATCVLVMVAVGFSLTLILTHTFPVVPTVLVTLLLVGGIVRLAQPSTDSGNGFLLRVLRGLQGFLDPGAGA